MRFRISEKWNVRIKDGVRVAPFMCVSHESEFTNSSFAYMFFRDFKYIVCYEHGVKNLRSGSFIPSFSC